MYIDINSTNRPTSLNSHSLVIAQVSVSSRHILVNDSYSFLQVCFVQSDTLKQNLEEGGKEGRKHEDRHT